MTPGIVLKFLIKYLPLISTFTSDRPRVRLAAFVILQRFIPIRLHYHDAALKSDLDKLKYVENKVYHSVKGLDSVGLFGRKNVSVLAVKKGMKNTKRDFFAWKIVTCAHDKKIRVC